MASRDSDQKTEVKPRESPQTIHVSKKFGRIICPSRMLLAGQSLSGKSQFIRHLIQYRDQVYDQKFSRIVYCSPACLNGGQDEYVDSIRKHFPELELSSELPNVNSLDLGSDEDHKLIIIDDMILQFNHSNAALRLLTIHSHHMNRRDK